MQVQKRTIDVPVFVLEDSDLEGIDDRARALGKLEPIRRSLEDKVQEITGRNVGVQIGFQKAGKYGNVPHLNIGSGTTLRAGDAIAFFPTGAVKSDASEVEPKPAPVKKAAKKVYYNIFIQCLRR